MGRVLRAVAIGAVMLAAPVLAAGPSLVERFGVEPLKIPSLVQEAETPEPTEPHEAEAYRIPFRYAPPGFPHMAIRLSLNSSPPMWFVLDTGMSAPLVVDHWVTKKLGLRRTGRVYYANPGRQKVEETRLETVRIIGIDQQNSPELPLHTAYALDLSPLRELYHGIPIGGIVGMPVFEEVILRIDFDRRELFVFSPEEQVRPRGSFARVSLVGEPGKWWVRAGAAGGSPVPLLLDTGSPFTKIPISAASDRGILRRTRTLGRDLQAPYLMDRVLLETLRLADFDVPRVAVDLAGPGQTPKLGLDVLSRFIVTLNVPTRSLVLERPPDYRWRARQVGWSGISLEWRPDGSYVIAHVEPASPGAAAGVRTGDRLLALDGRELTGLAPTALQDLLPHNAGDLSELILQRYGRRRRVFVTMGSEFDRPPSLLTGVTARRLPGQPLEITHVQTASPAARAGLRRGDHIEGVNGLPTDRWDLEEISRAFEASSVRLRVRRAGRRRPWTVHLRRQVVTSLTRRGWAGRTRR